MGGGVSCIRDGDRGPLHPGSALCFYSYEHHPELLLRVPRPGEGGASKRHHHPELESFARKKCLSPARAAGCRRSYVSFHVTQWLCRTSHANLPVPALPERLH